MPKTYIVFQKKLPLVSREYYAHGIGNIDITAGVTDQCLHFVTLYDTDRHTASEKVV